MKTNRKTMKTLAFQMNGSFLSAIKYKQYLFICFIKKIKAFHIVGIQSDLIISQVPQSR